MSLTLTADLQKGERVVNLDLLVNPSSYKPAGACPYMYDYTCKFAQSDHELIENFWPKLKHQSEGEPIDAKKASQQEGIDGEQCGEDAAAENDVKTS
ncbi:hypothetical protein B0H14DRAFT_3500135 [Mycena olivaceomarginata]|nr:hypothetical protein B0H14DRAFT_3500135 [Mycena olivaceomarginata]